MLLSSSPAVASLVATLTLAVALAGCAAKRETIDACLGLALGGLRPIGEERAARFLGKVQEDTARCRGGERIPHRFGQVECTLRGRVRGVKSPAPGPSRGGQELAGPHVKSVPDEESVRHSTTS